MKKLLSLSILAATLASTAAFAGPNSGPNVDAKDVYLASSHASNNVVMAIAAIQKASDNTKNPIKVKAVNAEFDQNGDLTSPATLALFSTLNAPDVEPIQVAAMSEVRAANNEFGWNACHVDAATNGDVILTISCIDSRQGHDDVKAYAVHNKRTSITIEQVKAKETVVSKLVAAKQGPSLSPVALIAKKG